VLDWRRLARDQIKNEESLMSLRLLPVVLAALAASCQSMSEGVLGLEARAIVYDDNTVDDFDAATSFDEEDVDVSGFGGHAAFNTPILDILGGIDMREYQDEDAPEASLGLRRRMFEFWRLHPFIEGNARYGFGLDDGVDEDDYTGWNAGVGALLDLTDHLYVNARLVYEMTTIDLPDGDTDIDGVIGTLGLGFHF
jgi:hypothetical protein